MNSPSRPNTKRKASPGVAPRRKPAPKQEAKAWSELDLETLQNALLAVPAPLEAPDLGMLDGFLVGVLLQERPASPRLWLPFVSDTEGRALPRQFDPHVLHSLVLRRRDELARAIAARQWFDPWVFADEGDDPAQAVLPWVMGFALANEIFPDLMDGDDPELLEPLSCLFRYLDPDDLEDADELMEAIESLLPPDSLDEAVEDLVRSSLLLEDISQPR